MAPTPVDRTIEDLDAAMRTLRRTMRGIPVRAGSFRNTHRNLVRDVAFLLVQLDSAQWPCVKSRHARGDALIGDRLPK